jgi:DNA-binding protein HU-beta
MTAERDTLAIARFYDACKKRTKGKKGYPKFKKDVRSVEYKTSGWKLSEDRKSIKFTDGCGIGTLKLKGTRDLSYYQTAQNNRSFASTRSSPKPPGIFLHERPAPSTQPGTLSLTKCAKMSPMTKATKKAPAKAPAKATKAPAAAKAVEVDKISKSHIVDMISNTTLTKKDSATLFDATLEVIVDALKQGKTVGLPGLGTLTVKATAARTGVKPGTAEKLQIPAGKKVTFKIAQDLKKSL